jgi:Protein of unknown function (DUF4007)
MKSATVEQIPAVVKSREEEPIRGTGQVSFSGHETFTLRHGWLKKGINALSSDPLVFVKGDAMVELGVGKNMVRSIRYWLLATGMANEPVNLRGNALTPTDLGNFIFGSNGVDPFLEDLNTLWLLHWRLATNLRRSTGWTWTFNTIPSSEFTRDSVLATYKAELRKKNLQLPSESSLRRDIDCMLRSYVPSRATKEAIEDSLECPLIELQLITTDSDNLMFRFERGPKPSLNDWLFCYSLIEFWNARTQGSTLSLSEVAFAFGSPGSVYKMDEDSIAVRLERLESMTDGCLRYDETSGLRQLYRHKAFASETALRNIYFGAGEEAV